MIEGSTPKSIEYIDEGIMNQLKKETATLLQLSQGLNKDQTLLQGINGQIKNSSNLSAEQFILSELIYLYNQFSIKETELSKFVLAYYYDVLRNQQFATEGRVEEYNQLILTEEFNNLLAKIKVENNIESESEVTGHYPLAGQLAIHDPQRYDALMQQYEKFISIAFGLQFNKKEGFGDVIGVEKIELRSDEKMTKTIPEEDSLVKVMEELNDLVGLEKVKEDVMDLINFLEVQKKREKQGLKNTEITLHTVFLGPPGTGKTTVARLLGRIFKHLGYLSKGQMLETDREGLVAGYVGQTATKVNKAVEDSLGGVLFIDEAYALSQNALGNDYGAEAISTLLKRMEDNRSDLAVVVAGYTEPMKLFIESNPGLRSRFNRYFNFEHFKPEELLEIFKSFCKRSDFITVKEADEKLLDTFDLCYEKRDDGFGNARDVRNIFEICVQNHANRIVNLKGLNKKILKTITEEDIPEPKEMLAHIKFFSTEE